MAQVISPVQSYSQAQPATIQSSAAAAPLMAAPQQQMLPQKMMQPQQMQQQMLPPQQQYRQPPVKSSSSTGFIIAGIVIGLLVLLAVAAYMFLGPSTTVAQNINDNTLNNSSNTNTTNVNTNAGANTAGSSANAGANTASANAGANTAGANTAGANTAGASANAGANTASVNTSEQSLANLTFLPLRNKRGKFLSIKDNRKDKGADMVQYSKVPTENQLWAFDGKKLKNKYGFCLDTQGNSADNSTRIQQWDCIDDHKGQEWELTPEGLLRNGHGKCLDTQGNSSEDNAKIQQWDCIGNEGQSWAWDDGTLPEITPKVEEKPKELDFKPLRNNHGKYLSIKDNSKDSGAPMVQYGKVPTDNQAWAFDGKFLKNKYGKCLDVVGNSNSNGAIIQQWDCQPGNKGQEWELTSSGVLKNGHGKCLDVYENSSNDNAKIHQWDCNYNAGQTWKFEGPDTYSYVKNKKGYYLAVSQNSAENNTGILHWDKVPGENGQQWKFEDGLLKNKHGKCLMVNSSGWAVQSDCNRDSAHTWNLVGNSIKNPDTGKCIDIYNNKWAGEAACSSYDSQQWQLEAFTTDL